MLLLVGRARVLRLLFLGAFATALVDCARAELPSGIIEIVRQLDEWHGKSAFWVRETARAYQTNQAPLVKLKESYIEASSVANSLIDQLKLQTASRSKISLNQYKPHFARAKTATEVLAEEGKRLLLQTTESKTRGATKAAGKAPDSGDQYAQFS